MFLPSFCIFSFCVSLGSFNSKEYQLELQVTSLKQVTDLTVQNFTYLHNALEYDVELAIEQTIHELISVFAGDAVEDVKKLTQEAKDQDLDTEGCESKFEQSLVPSINTAIEESKPCVIYIEESYKSLKAELEVWKKNAEDLAASAKGVVAECAKLGGEEEFKCVENRVKTYADKQKSLAKQHGVFTEKYEEALALKDEAIACLSEQDVMFFKNLHATVELATECIHAL